MLEMLTARPPALMDAREEITYTFRGLTPQQMDQMVDRRTDWPQPLVQEFIDYARQCRKNLP
jgi:hypothetical protein